MTFEIENVYPEVVLPDYETVIKNVIEAALDYEKCPYEVQVYVLLTDNGRFIRSTGNIARLTVRRMFFLFQWQTIRCREISLI